MRNPPNTYVLLAFSIVSAFAIPSLQKRFERKGMSKGRAFISSFGLCLVTGVLVIRILEAILGL